MVMSRPWKRDLRWGATVKGATVSKGKSSSQGGVRVFTLSGEELFLRRRLVVHAVEGEGEYLGLVFRARNPHKGRGFALFAAGGTDYDVLVELIFKQRPDTGHNTNRHCESTRRERERETIDGTKVGWCKRCPREGEKEDGPGGGSTSNNAGRAVELKPRPCLRCVDLVAV